MAEMMKVSDLVALPVFPYAAKFRILSGKEMEELEKDVYNNGLIHPLVIWEGQLLDGRNRLQVLQVPGIDITEVSVVEFQGTELEAARHVNSCNLRRRHLASGELAALATDFNSLMLKEEARQCQSEAGENYGRGLPQKLEGGHPQAIRDPQTRDIVAAEFGINGTSLQIAEKLKQSPVAQDLFQEMAEGKITLTQANDRFKARTDKFSETQEYVRRFPEAWEKYQSDELDIWQAHQLAKKIEAEKKAARARVVSETVIKMEHFLECAQIQLHAINLTIGEHCQTPEAIKQVREVAAKVDWEWAGTMNALKLQEGFNEREGRS